MGQVVVRGLVFWLGFATRFGYPWHGWQIGGCLPTCFDDAGNFSLGSEFSEGNSRQVVLADVGASAPSHATSVDYAGGARIPRKFVKI
jgi:hypothetical protein